jgi:hypothetical protein
LNHGDRIHRSAEIKQIGAWFRTAFSQAFLPDTLYISGKRDQLPDGSNPATFERVRQTPERQVGPQGSGSRFPNVVFSNVYIDKYENAAMVNKVYSEF